MLKQVQKRKQAGFTIIEVLIVLAIAGLIMLVVFLAVPALNRNSHNQQYKTEANNIMSAYQEQSNNNGGGALTASVSTTANSDAANVLTAANTKTITKLTISTTVGAVTPNIGEAVVETAAKCASQGSNTPVAGTSRSVALVYQIETTSSSNQYQCVSS
jgi:type IV pilus assembly protein PilA